MKNKMKIYHQLSRAIKAAEGKPFLKVGELYIVGVDDLTEVGLLAPQENSSGVAYAGEIILMHLDRLGNGNWAEQKQPRQSRPFAFERNRSKAEKESR